MSNLFMKYWDIITCSFCLRRGRDLEMMVSGQYSFICYNCVLICFKIFFNYKNINLFNNRNLNYNYNNRDKKFLKIFKNFNKNKFFTILENQKNWNFLISNYPYYNFKYKFYDFNNNKNIIRNKKDYLNFDNNYILYKYYKKLIYNNVFFENFIKIFDKNFNNSDNFDNFKFNYIEFIFSFNYTYSGNKIPNSILVDNFDGITDEDYKKFNSEFIINILINFQDEHIYKYKRFEFSGRLLSSNKLNKKNTINNLKKHKFFPKKIIYNLENHLKSACNKNLNFSYSKDFKELFYNDIYYNFKDKYIDLNLKLLDEVGDIFYENINELEINLDYDNVINYYNNIYNLEYDLEFYDNFIDIKTKFDIDIDNDFISYYNFNIDFYEKKNYNYKGKYNYIFNSSNNFDLNDYINNNFKNNFNFLEENNFNFDDNLNKDFDGYFNLDFNNYNENKLNTKYVFKTIHGENLISTLKDNSLNNYLNKKLRNNDLELSKKNNYIIKKNKFLEGLPTPKDLKTYLDNYITGQDSAKRILSLSIYNHFKRLKFNLMYGYNLPKSNVLLIGPSGSGKTYIMQTLSKILNVPFVIADATTLTEAGYVGEDVEGVIQKLFQESDFDIEKTEMGIVYIDEIDKISKKNSDHSGGNRDISGEGVQQALLKLIEGTTCPVCFTNNRKNFNQNFVNINTENILFICGGAFFNLEKIISEKEDKISIGFSNNNLIKKKSDDNTSKVLNPEDLVKFGLIPELIGRLPIIAKLNELDVDVLIKILKDPNSSIINYYNILLSPENIKLTIDDEAIEIIAKIAYNRKMGARGLRSIIDNILSDVLYEAPEIDTLREIIIHKYVFEGDCRTPLLVHYDLF